MWTFTAWVVDRAGTTSFFFNDTATTEIYTLSLHDALPISGSEDSGFSSVDDLTNINYWHFVANVADEPAFGYLHELSPSGGQLTGGGQDAHLVVWRVLVGIATDADPVGGFGGGGARGEGER